MILARLLANKARGTNGHTLGRLTVAAATNAPGCPIIDASTTRIHDDPSHAANGVVLCASPRGGPGIAVAWRGAPDLYPYLMRLRRVPGLRALVTSRGHLA